MLDSGHAPEIQSANLHQECELNCKYRPQSHYRHFRRNGRTLLKTNLAEALPTANTQQKSIPPSQDQELRPNKSAEYIRLPSLKVFNGIYQQVHYSICTYMYYPLRAVTITAREIQPSSLRTSSPFSVERTSSCGRTALRSWLRQKGLEKRSLDRTK